MEAGDPLAWGETQADRPLLRWQWKSFPGCDTWGLRIRVALLCQPNDNYAVKGESVRHAGKYREPSGTAGAKPPREKAEATAGIKISRDLGLGLVQDGVRRAEADLIGF